MNIVNISGGRGVEMNDDEFLLWQAFCIVRKGRKATLNKIASCIRFRSNITHESATRWVKRILKQFRNREVFAVNETKGGTIVTSLGAVTESMSLRLRAVERYGNHCVYCSKKVWGENLTLDHVIPASKGGGDTVENCRPCCFHCNQLKADRTPAEWAADIMRVCPVNSTGQVRRLTSVAATLMTAVFFWR